MGDYEMLHAPKAQGNKENQKCGHVRRLLSGRGITLRRCGHFAFIVLIALFTGGLGLLFGQGTSGYTKVNTSPITGTSFTSPTLTDGVAYNFEVTALNSAGVESGPSNIVTAIVPATGTHTATISWTPGSNDVTFNVYAQIVNPANPPSAVQVIIN